MARQPIEKKLKNNKTIKHCGECPHREFIQKMQFCALSDSILKDITIIPVFCELEDA